MTARRVGSTTAAAKAALAVDGVLVCATEMEAARLRREHPGLRTVSRRPESLRGTSWPVLVDHHAWEMAERDLSAETASRRASEAREASAKDAEARANAEAERLLARVDVLEGRCAWAVDLIQNVSRRGDLPDGTEIDRALGVLLGEED